VLAVGDEVEVEIIDIDDRGKISLDRLDKPDAPPSSGGGDRGASGGGGDRDRGPRRDDRGGEGRRPRRRN